MKTFSILFLALISFSLAERCKHPQVASNYKNSLYAGRWYEIGKIQTPGGAFFQRGTVCTIVTYNPEDPEVGGGDIGYSARQDTPTGSYVNATGTLTQLDEPGHFQQQLYFFGVPGPTVDYNIIYIDDEAAIEYDCNEGFLGIGHDYCIHIIARSPTLSQEKTDQLISFAENLGLNTESLAYKKGVQEGCW